MTICLLAAFEIMGRARDRRARLSDIAQSCLYALDLQPYATATGEHQIDGAAPVFFRRKLDVEQHCHGVGIVLPDILRLNLQYAVEMQTRPDAHAQISFSAIFPAKA